MSITPVTSEPTESVIFQPVDQIFNSISSMILTTTIDFNPYRNSLLNVNDYTFKIKEQLTAYTTTFVNSDPRYSHLLNLTMEDLSSVLKEFTDIQIEAFNLIYHVYSPKTTRNKRSVLPFGRLFNFLFGTANDEDLQNMKQDIQRLYDNQVDQANVLNDIISIANVSRGLINENIKKINEIIGTISFLNETIDSLAEKLKPMYITRRFYLLHTETQIHHFRIRTLIRQISKDIDLVKGYLNIHSTGRITPTTIDPIHLKQELLKIHKQPPARLSFPEDPTTNIGIITDS